MVETGRQDIDTAQRIDRASSNDLVTLATDRGQVPLNLGAVLIIERGSELDAAGVRVAVEQRLPNVPRMRRRLLRAPLGCGRAVWVDDVDFRLDRHLSALGCLHALALRRDPSKPMTRSCCGSPVVWCVRRWTAIVPCGQRSGSPG